jgi:hypothetical protein
LAAYKALHLPHQPVLKTPDEYGGLKYENFSFQRIDKIISFFSKHLLQIKNNI